MYIQCVHNIKSKGFCLLLWLGNFPGAIKDGKNSLMLGFLEKYQASYNLDIGKPTHLNAKPQKKDMDEKYLLNDI